MENTSQTPQIVSEQPQASSNANYPPLPPQNPPQEIKTGKNMSVVLVLGVLVVIVVLGSAYLYFSKPPKTYNATVYNSNTPIPTKKVASPTPTTAQVNANDNSNKALDSDSQIINQDINNVSSNIDSVDQSFNDKQTNLQ